QLPKPFLVKQVDVNLPVYVAGGDSRPLRIDRPLDPDDRRVALRDVLDISKGQVARDLLLQRQRRLRRVRISSDLRIDLQFADAEEPLQSTRNRICHRLTQQRRGAGLLEVLLQGGLFASRQDGIRRGRFTGGKQRNDLANLQRRVGAI